MIQILINNPELHFLNSDKDIHAYFSGTKLKIVTNSKKQNVSIPFEKVIKEKEYLLLLNPCLTNESQIKSLLNLFEESLRFRKLRIGLPSFLEFSLERNNFAIKLKN